MTHDAGARTNQREPCKNQCKNEGCIKLCVCWEGTRAQWPGLLKSEQPWVSITRQVWVQLVKWLVGAMEPRAM